MCLVYERVSDAQVLGSRGGVYDLAEAGIAPWMSSLRTVMPMTPNTPEDRPGSDRVVIAPHLPHARWGRGRRYLSGVLQYPSFAWFTVRTKRIDAGPGEYGSEMPSYMSGFESGSYVWL